METIDRRPSVRDLASKFDKGRKGAAKGAPGAKATDADQVSGEAEFQKLRRLLVDVRGRVAGRNKDDVEKALGRVEALEVTYTKRGTELAKGRGQVKNLVLRIKQVADDTNDAKALLEDARSVAISEIEAAKESVTKLQNVLQEHGSRMWTASDNRELQELKREAHEARRIKMLHESSKVTDMEHQINALRQQLTEKAAETLTLRKEVEKLKEQGRGGAPSLFNCLLTGDERLGSTLSIAPVDDKGTDLSYCTIQWYQIKDGRTVDVISGAIRPQYAPEPLDVGRLLRAEISLPGGKTQAVQTTRPIEPARGLDQYVESLASKGSAQFNVRIVLKNGETVEKQHLHIFDVSKTRIKLHKGHSVKAKEIYSASMQLCGARGGGDSAAQGLFWVPKKDQTFMLVLESVRERNAAIMLARQFGKLHNIRLQGPGDVIQLEA